MQEIVLGESDLQNSLLQAYPRILSCQYLLKKLNKTRIHSLNPSQTPAIVCLLCAEPPLSDHQRAPSVEAVSVGVGWTERDFGLPLHTAVFSNNARMLGPSVFKDSQSSQ